MTPAAADTAAWSAWVRGDHAAAVDAALADATDERMLRLACGFALRAHRTDLLVPHREAVAALPPSIERDAVLATMWFGEGDTDRALALAFSLAEGEGLPEPDARLGSGASLRAASIVHVGLSALASGAWTTARACIDAATRALGPRAADPATEATRFDLLGMAAIVEVHTVSGDRALRALEGALAPLRAQNLLGGAHALAVIALGDVARARGELSKAAVNLSRGARLAGSRRPGFVSHAQASLAFVRIRQGRWADAAAAVDRMPEVDPTIERDWIRTQVVAMRGLIAAMEGDLATSAALLADAQRMFARTPSFIASIVMLHAQIAGAIARGDWRALEHALDDAEEPGYRHPYELGEWNALKLLAAWHLRNLVGFRSRLVEWGLTSNAVEDSYYWAFVAILAEHEDRHADGIAAIERALDSLRHDSDPLGRAWVRMVAGTYLRRHGDGGRPAPARALAVYDEAIAELTELGASAFVERCTAIIADTADEFERSRHARPASLLTAQQRRIADAVAQGYTSDEIAAIEYLSKRTIDYHVANIMRRLGVTNRREIARALE